MTGLKILIQKIFRRGTLILQQNDRINFSVQKDGNYVFPSLARDYKVKLYEEFKQSTANVKEMK